MLRRWVLLCALALAGGPLSAQSTKIDLAAQSKNVDFSSATSTKPFKTGSTLPATCTAGEAFFKIDASTLYGCVSANSWQPLTGGGGGGGGGTGNMQVATGVGSPTGSCTPGQSWYEDISLSPRALWYCNLSGVWRKVVDTSGVGPFTLTGQTNTTPAQPPSGFGSAWFDTTDKVFKSIDDSNAVATTVRAQTCTTHGAFLRSIATSGTASCSGDPGTSVYERWDFLAVDSYNGDYEGWKVAWDVGGSGGQIASPANHPGVVQIRTDTGATSDVYLISKLGQYSSNTLNPAETFEGYFLFRLNGTQPDSNQGARVGFFGDFASQPAAGIYVEKLAGETSWFGVARSGGVQSRSAAVAPVTNSWVVLFIRRVNASTIGFRMASTVAGIASATEQTVVANIPTATLFSTFHFFNTSGVARSMDIDAADLLITGITR